MTDAGMSLDVRALAIRELVHDGEFIEAARLQTMWQRHDAGWPWTAEQEAHYAGLRRLSSFRALPWYRRAWLTLIGKAPR